MLEQSPLGRQTAYDRAYSPEILFCLPRSRGREALGLTGALPFTGVDLWTGYELSWLNAKNKPMVAVGTFYVPADSPRLIESKSFKLYLNSFNGTRFASIDAVKAALVRDLSGASGAPVAVTLVGPTHFGTQTQEPNGICIDDADIAVEDFRLRPELLQAAGPPVEEALFSHLLRSNCPVTGQPDWASVRVRYAGPRIDRAALLRYIVSFREHTGFHEQCVEQMFVDIKARCNTTQLTVYARYTRRGGLDINPFRSDFEDAPKNLRNFRQ